MRMSLLKCLAIAVLAVAGISVSVSSAHAASSTTCTGSFAISFSPGLTNTPQTVVFSETDTYSSCTSTDTSLTAGSWSGTSTNPGASCNNAGAFLGPEDYTITWNNSQSSTITSLAVTEVIIGGIVQLTGVGTVTSGEFIGGVATIVWVTSTPNPLLCLTSQGITSQSGTITLQITVTP